MGPFEVRVGRPHGHEAVRAPPGPRGRRPLRQAPPPPRHLRQRRRHRQVVVNR